MIPKYLQPHFNSKKVILILFSPLHLRLETIYNVKNNTEIIVFIYKQTHIGLFNMERKKMSPNIFYFLHPFLL